MRSLTVFITVSLLLAVLAAPATSGEKKSWDLDGVEEIDLDGVSGDVIIVRAEGRKGRVELESDVRPSDAFEAVVERRGDELDIEEEWYGSSSGPVRWTIYLPERGKAPSIKISNASGDLQCTDVSVEIKYNTASGDVELSSVTLGEGSKFNTASGDYRVRDMTIGEDTKFNTASGDVELEDLVIKEEASFSTASGDIIIANCKAGDDVSFSSASGDVKVRSIELTGEADFSSASGDVELEFDRLPKHDLTASSASGDVTLKVDDYGKNFTLVLIKRKDRGRISCPFDYTDEEEFYRNRQEYVSKIVERGSGKPVITLRTASGKVTVKD
jgi:DUF4097 and DUF4098 domain-containing protein YvlB